MVLRRSFLDRRAVSVAVFIGLGMGLSTELAAQTTEINKIFVDDVLERVEERGGKVVYTGDKLELGENDELIIEEDARIYLDELKLDRTSKINAQGQSLELMVADELESDFGFIDISSANDLETDTSGENGQDGDDGVKALDGLKGSAGAHGSDATSGSDGSSAADILVITPRIKGNVVLIARGGNGGRGGKGGDGGRGGQGFSGQDARILYEFEGLKNTGVSGLIELGAMIGVPYVGQVLAILKVFNGLQIGDGFDGFDGGAGGDAGAGGDGGNGGDGGEIELIFASKADDAKIYVSTRAGRAGAGGAAGVPGPGGRGGEGGKAGDIWARDGNPGNPGAMGAPASSGQAGQAGEPGTVQVIETGDEEWLKCYIRYRQSLDLGVPQELANDILRSCVL